MSRTRQQFMMRYGIAILAPVVALLLSLLGQSIIIRVPFLLFFAALAISAGYGGFGPGMLTSFLSVIFVSYFFFPPYYMPSLDATSITVLALFIIDALIVSWVYEARRRAETAAQQQGEQLRTTLASIGDGVITTDQQGRVAFINGVAEQLSGWAQMEANGHPIQDIFRIFNQYSRQPAENPIERALREGVIVGLANHTVLISRTGQEYAIDDSASPIRNAAGKITGAVLVFRDITQRQRQLDTQQFLSESSRVLGSSLDYQTTLASVARLAVPKIADWCTVHVVQPGGKVEQLALAHVDPAKIEWARDIQRRYPDNPDAPAGLYNVIRTGQPEFYQDIPDAMLVAAAGSDQALLQVLRDIHYTSVMIVPLIARGQSLGAIQMVSTESGRRYEQADLELAQQLAARAAIAIDNARLFVEAQDARKAAERLADRANRLQTVTSNLSSLLQPSDVAQAIVEQCLNTLDSAYGGLVVTLVDDQWLEVMYSQGYTEKSMQRWARIPMSSPGLPIVYSINRHEPLFLSSHEQWRLVSPDLPDGMTSASLALAPLVIEDRAIGALVIGFDKVQAFDPEDRVFIISLAQQCAQALERARSYGAEQQARLSAEASQKRLKFLTEASEMLSESLDFQKTLVSIGNLTVPTIADWCTIHLVQKDGSVVPIVTHHSDPEKIRLGEEFRRRYPSNPQATTGVYNVLRTGKSEFNPAVTEELLAKVITDPEQLQMLRQFSFKAGVLVPIIVRSKPMGVIQLIMAESGRELTLLDVALAEELARRASSALENSLLYDEAREQQERLRVTLASIGDAVIATDATGRITFMNMVAQEVTGWTQDDTAGKMLHEVFVIINETTRQTVESPVDKVLRTGTIVGLANHTVLIAKNGQEIPIDDSGAPIHNEAGETIGIILTFRDITERKEAERETEQLYERIARLQDVTAALSGALTPADVAEVFVERAVIATGAAAGSLLQLKDDQTLEIIGLANYSPDLVRAWLHTPINAPVPLAEAARTRNAVWISSREDWYNHYSTPPVSSYQAWAALPLIVKDRMIGAIGFSFAADTSFATNDQGFMITLAAQAAQALDRALLYEAQQQARQDAERAKQRIAFLAEASALLSSSLDYEMTFRNLAQHIIPAFADNYNVNIFEEDGSLRVVALAASQPDAEAAIREIAARYPTDPKGLAIRLAARSGETNYVVQVSPEIIAAYAQDADHAALLRRVGTRSYINLPLKNREQIIGVLSIGMAESGRSYDASDIPIAEELAHRAAQAVDNARLYDQAKRAIQLRDEFLSVAAHELKTPITSMRGFAQTLLRQLDKRGTLDIPQVERALRVVDQQSAKLTTLISQLLDISRLEAGRLLLERTITDLPTLVGGVITNIQRGKPYPIDLQAPESLSVYIDPLRLEQVVINLLDNAIKYSPERETIQVDIATLDAQNVTIAVTDQGIGIPVENRGRLFERFYQAHQDGYKGGLGLGLYISQQIIQLHGGQIQAEFPERGGTRFVVRLPLTQESPMLDAQTSD